MCYRAVSGLGSLVSDLWSRILAVDHPLPHTGCCCLHCLRQVISRRLRLEGNFDFKYVAKKTPGKRYMSR